MSIISSSTTSTTAYKVTADTTGTLVLQTGSTPTTAVTIDTAQNLGLGVTPSAWGSGEYGLQTKYGSFVGNSGINIASNAYYNAGWKYINTASASYYSQGSGQHAWYYAGSGTAGNAISFTQAMTLDASGNLLIGATSGSYPLLVKKAASSSDNSTVSIVSGTAGYAQLLLGDTASDAVGYVAYNNSSNSLEIATNGSERARIDSSGRLLVGTTGALVNESAFGATSSGNTSCFKTTGGAGVSAILVWNSGTSGTRDLIQFSTGSSYSGLGSINTNGSTITYGGTSDYRLKENIAPMTGALAAVAQLKPCTFTWKNTGIEDNGFIAHELQEVCPNAVVGEKDAVNEDGSIKPQQIDTSFLVATLTAAIQEQQAIIETLTNRISALENK